MGAKFKPSALQLQNTPIPKEVSRLHFPALRFSPQTQTPPSSLVLDTKTATPAGDEMFATPGSDIQIPQGHLGSLTETSQVSLHPQSWLAHLSNGRLARGFLGALKLW